mgnify:CR=1 FL=1
MLTEMDKDIEITSSEEDVKETVQNTENCEPSEALQETSETEEAGTEETEEVKSDDNDKKKSKLFGKKEKKKDKKDIQIEELNAKVIRQMAEFDNFRKRTEKEKSQMFDSGASTMIEKLLPVVDDFERGIAAMSDDDKETSFAQGMEMIYKKMMGILEGAGVTAIEAVGKEFDPNFHNAVMQTASEEYDSGVIAQELQKGYMYKEKVIRHSMVIVAE